MTRWCWSRCMGPDWSAPVLTSAPDRRWPFRNLPRRNSGPHRSPSYFSCYSRRNSRRPATGKIPVNHTSQMSSSNHSCPGLLSDSISPASSCVSHKSRGRLVFPRAWTLSRQSVSSALAYIQADAHWPSVWHADAADNREMPDLTAPYAVYPVPSTHSSSFP